MNADTQYDTIVLGSGMGGMTAAGMLTHAGYKVLVLEAAHALGGIPQSMTRSLLDWTSASPPFEGLYLCGDTVFRGRCNIQRDQRFQTD